MLARVEMVESPRWNLGKQLPQEAPAIIPDRRPPTGWPSLGEVEINNLTLKVTDTVTGEALVLFVLMHPKGARARSGLCLIIAGLSSSLLGLSSRYSSAIFSEQYATSSEPVLHGLTFHVPPRTRVGIVGRTGAGKSSLMNALFR